MYLKHPQFPLSSTYDPMWVFENEMGPNALWLTEFVCEAMDLRPGMRVLDMGCGRAMSSIFLAKEFGVQVVANDFWIGPSENWERIRASGLEKQIMPIRAEGSELPYAERYFDAAISIDSYPYFGEGREYAAYFSRFVRHGGQIGISHIALARTYAEAESTGIPSYLRKWYTGDVDYEKEPGEVDPESLIHTLHEWKERIECGNAVSVRTADLMENGCLNHVRFLEEHRQAGFTYRGVTELADWKEDAGANFGFLRIVGEVL